MELPTSLFDGQELLTVRSQDPERNTHLPWKTNTKLQAAELWEHYLPTVTWELIKPGRSKPVVKPSRGQIKSFSLCLQDRDKSIVNDQSFPYKTERHDLFYQVSMQDELYIDTMDKWISKALRCLSEVCTVAESSRGIFREVCIADFVHRWRNV